MNGGQMLPYEQHYMRLSSNSNGKIIVTNVEKHEINKNTK